MENTLENIYSPIQIKYLQNYLHCLQGSGIEKVNVGDFIRNFDYWLKKDLPLEKIVDEFSLDKRLFLEEIKNFWNNNQKDKSSITRAREVVLRLFKTSTYSIEKWKRKDHPNTYIGPGDELSAKIALNLTMGDVYRKFSDIDILKFKHKNFGGSSRKSLVKLLEEAKLN